MDSTNVERGLSSKALCRYCGEPESRHEFTGKYRGVYCYLLGDCTIYRYQTTGGEAPRSRSVTCLESTSGCMAHPMCTITCIYDKGTKSGYYTDWTDDPVSHPKHYTQHPSGIECIQITQHMNFCLGNAMKYIWRADLKNGIEDLEKARWYIDREIELRKASQG